MPKPPTSELAWTLADYRTAGAEPPARIVSNPESTEGEMMREDEIEEFVKDSIATMRILSDRHSARLDEILANYRADLDYLVSLGRLTDDDYNDLTHPDNLHF
jgi:hypothetical protein